VHLFLIRHGETEWNVERRMQGNTDIPLNARGRAQAELLAMRIAANGCLDVLYSSTLQRARVTAEAIARVCALTPIWDERLIEKGMGELEGLTLAEFEQRYPDLYRARMTSTEHVALPGEESPAQLYERVQAFLDDVCQRHTKGTRIGIVSHGGTLSMILSILLGVNIWRRSPFWMDNASVSVVDLSGPCARVRLLNDTCHLAEDE